MELRRRVFWMHNGTIFELTFSRCGYAHVDFHEDQGVELCVHNLAITWINEWTRFLMCRRLSTNIAL